MGAHIRAFRKVISAVPHSGKPCVGLAVRCQQPKGGKNGAERLDAALWGALLLRDIVQLVTERSAILCWKGCSSDMRLKSVLYGGDILHACKLPTLHGPWCSPEST